MTLITQFVTHLRERVSTMPLRDLIAAQTFHQLAANIYQQEIDVRRITS